MQNTEKKHKSTSMCVYTYEDGNVKYQKAQFYSTLEILILHMYKIWEKASLRDKKTEY